MAEPRVYMHPDGQYISIGFSDTPDTILKVGGQDGPAGARDVERARRWVAAVAALIESASGARPS